MNFLMVVDFNQFWLDGRPGNEYFWISQKISGLLTPLGVHPQWFETTVWNRFEQFLLLWGGARPVKAGQGHTFNSRWPSYFENCILFTVLIQLRLVVCGTSYTSCTKWRMFVCCFLWVIDLHAYVRMDFTFTILQENVKLLSNSMGGLKPMITI